MRSVEHTSNPRLQILTSPFPRKRGRFGNTQPGEGSHLAPCRPDPLLSRCAASQPGFVAMVKALTRLVFPLISCCTKATAALHLTAMAQQQGISTSPKTGNRSSTAPGSFTYLLNILNPSAFEPYQSSRDLTITRKGAGQSSDLIIRGCIPSYLKRR